MLIPHGRLITEVVSLRSHKWPFEEDTEWLCQLAHSCQGVPRFMSSMAIVAIGELQSSKHTQDSAYHIFTAFLSPLQLRTGTA